MSLMLLAWCGSNQKCSPCPPPAPPIISPGGPPGSTSLQSTVNIQQVQFVYGQYPPPAKYFYGYMSIANDGSVPTGTGFGSFASWPSPYIVINQYVSVQTIGQPWEQGYQQIQLPSITVGGNAPQDVIVAQQAAITQAYTVLRIPQP